MSHKEKIFLSSKEKNLLLEVFRRDMFDVKSGSLPWGQFSDYTLVAIDRVVWWHLFLPFRKKLLFILEYSVIRRMPWWCETVVFLFSDVFVWEMSRAARILGAKQVDSYFPIRAGIAYHQQGAPSLERTISDLVKLATSNPKEKVLSCVQSNKAITKQHRQRIRLMEYLAKSDLPLSLYGRDSVPVADKADCLLDFQYHIAIENDNAGASEKLFDPLICRCVVFYGGRVNQLSPLLRRLIIPIDIYDEESALSLITNEIKTGSFRSHIKESDWTQCLSYMLNNHTLEGLLDRYLSGERSKRGVGRGS